MQWICITLLFLLTFATHERNKVWLKPETIWQDIVAKSPEKMRGHLNLGQIYQNTGRWADAMKEYEKVASLEADGPATAFKLRTGALSNIASIQIDSRQFDAALKTFDRITDWTNEAYINKGVLLLRLHRYEEALAVFDVAVEKWPATSGMLHFNRGEALRVLGRTEEAIRAYKTAEAIDPALLDSPAVRKIYIDLKIPTEPK